MDQLTLAGFDPATLLIVILVARIVAAQIFKKDPSKPADDTPTTLSVQGARIPRVLGVRRVGAIHVWAGKRTITTEKVKGNGKGGSPSASTTIYYEQGIHVLAVGPGRALRRILVQGEPIFEGPIDPQNAPSGTVVDLPNGEGSFQIFWGREDDPIDEWAADEDRLGISSRWPFLFRINWRPRRLGQIAQWPITDYEIECEPEATIPQLTEEDAWFEGTLSESESGATRLIGLDKGSGTFFFEGFVSFQFLGAQRIRVKATTALSNSDLNVGDEYTVVSVSEQLASETTLLTQIFCSTANGVPIITSALNPGYQTTAVRVLEPLTGSQIITAQALCTPSQFAPGGTLDGVLTNIINDLGSAVALVEGDDNGANGAHIIAETLFQPFPRGIGLDQKFWDLTSIGTVSQVVVDEGIRSSTIAEQSQTAQSLLGELLIDLGVFIRLNPQTGLLEFVPLRANSLNLITVPDEALQGTLPQITYNIQPLRPNRVIFSFSDRSQGYKDQTIVVDDDGAARLNDFEGVEESRIATVTDFDSAAVIALRRDAEALGQTDQLQVSVGFQGRYLRPGDLIKIPDYPLNLLVLKSQFDPDDVGAILDVAPTSYLAPTTPLQLLSPTQATGGAPPPLAAASRLWTPPLALQVTSAPEAALLWVRANESASAAIANLSSSGVNYKVVGLEGSVAVGGVIESAIPDAAGTIDTVFATFDGPDANTTIDLTGDQTAQDNGQLLCLINDELFFIAGVSADQFGAGAIASLQRAKYGTTQVAHPIGSRFWVFEPNQWTPLVDSALIVTGQTVLVKVQPIGIGSPVGLDLIEAVEFTPSTPTS